MALLRNNKEKNNHSLNRVHDEHAYTPQQLKAMIDEKDTREWNAVSQATYNICELIDCKVWKLSTATKKVCEHMCGKISSRDCWIDK